MEQSIADKLGKWINPLAHSTKRKGLLVMGLLTSLVCVWLVIHSVRSPETSSILEVDSITRPTDIFPQDTIPASQTEQDIIRQYNRMMRLKELIERPDSEANRKTLDSLIRASPGLLDSLNDFIKMYYSH